MTTKNNLFFSALDRETKLAIAEDLFDRFYKGDQYTPKMNLEIAQKYSKGTMASYMGLMLEIASMVSALRKVAYENGINELEVYLAYMNELKGKTNASWLSRLYDRVFN